MKLESCVLAKNKIAPNVLFRQTYYVNQIILPRERILRAVDFEKISMIQYPQVKGREDNFISNERVRNQR
jgi:hypothetical protein